jgi:hypothetical protein
MSNFCLTKQRADRYDVNNTESLGGPLGPYARMVQFGQSYKKELLVTET